MRFVRNFMHFLAMKNVVKFVRDTVCKTSTTMTQNKYCATIFLCNNL